MPGSKTQNIVERLKGFSSDHGWQTIAITDTGPKSKVTLRGLTWNLLNKGHAKGKGPYSNNPFDIQETEKDYVDRKRQQFAGILDIIEARQSISTPLDFILLQEVNAFTRGEIDGAPATQKMPVRQPIKGLKEVVDHFKQQLLALGWQLELTHPKINSKPMVTLYNTHTLKRQGEAKGFLMADGKNTGFELPFVHRKSKKPVAIANLHLSFGSDNRKGILEYQFEQIQKGIFTVMGGDTNHPPNYQLDGLIGNFNYATNIDCDPKNPNRVTDVDERTGGKFKKHYDGFFCSPGGADNRVSAIETKGICFEVKNGLPKPRIYDPSKEYPKHAQHEALTHGVPWIRTKSKDKLMPYVDAQTRKRLNALGKEKPIVKKSTAIKTASTKQKSWTQLSLQVLLIAGGLGFALFVTPSLGIAVAMIGMFLVYAGSQLTNEKLIANQFKSEADLVGNLAVSLEKQRKVNDVKEQCGDLMRGLCYAKDQFMRSSKIRANKIDQDKISNNRVRLV